MTLSRPVRLSIGVLFALAVTGATLVGCAVGGSDAGSGTLPAGGASSGTARGANSATGGEPGRLISLGGTRWSGTDSTGDKTVFAFNRDNSVTVSFGSHSYGDPQDVWVVEHGVLTVSVYIDSRVGVATYIGDFDPASGRIDAVATTSIEHDTWTVRLTQRDP